MSIWTKIPYMKSLGTRLKERRKELKLTQRHIAQEIGVTPVSVTLWEKESTLPKGENLYSLCRVLKCSANWLLYGKETKLVVSKDGTVVPGPQIQALVPVISLKQAANWVGLKDIDRKDVTEWQETIATVGSNAFILRMKDDSMTNPNGTPSLPEGSYVTSDPDIPAKDGDIVVVKIEGIEEAVVKKLVIDGPNKYLKSLNPDYKPIPTDGDNSKIIGVCLQVSFKLRSETPNLLK